jgi:hypothetical protein
LNCAPPCFRCERPVRDSDRLYCGRCRDEANAPPPPWAPAMPLAFYGEPPTPAVPQGKGSTDVAFWKAVLAEVVRDEVTGQVADQVDRKFESVRVAYARLRDGIRTHGEDAAGVQERLTELEEAIDQLRRPGPRQREPMREELEV